MPEEGTETAVLSNGHLGKMSLWLYNLNNNHHCSLRFCIRKPLDEKITFHI
jgi:hypothetical protein